MVNFSLEGKVALVTGASYGIGFALATAYAQAIGVYISLGISRTADWGNSLSRWESKAQVPQQLFGRHAIPMVWDFSEANIFSTSTGSFLASILQMLIHHIVYSPRLPYPNIFRVFPKSLIYPTSCLRSFYWMQKKM